jgi:hypothetical protein
MAPTKPTSTATKKSKPVKNPQAKFAKAWKFKKYREPQGTGSIHEHVSQRDGVAAPRKTLQASRHMQQREKMHHCLAIAYEQHTLSVPSAQRKARDSC